MRLLRDALHLTQQAFADMTGVGRTCIANYETAVRRPDIDEAIKICGATGVPMDWIYRGTMAFALPAHIASRITGLQRGAEEEAANP